MRSVFVSLLAVCLAGTITAAHAQSYTHVAPHLSGGTAVLTGTSLRTHVSVGLTAAGRVEHPSRTRTSVFGPWLVYPLMRRYIIGSPIESLDGPVSFQLSPNYPNPFNPTTTIRFSLAAPVHTGLTVYDALGRTVAVLVDDHRAAGTYAVPFDTAGLPSGLYFYRLDAGGYHATRPMLFAK